MSLITLTAQLLNEVGVSAADILNEAGVDRESAIKRLANELGVDVNELADDPTRGRGEVREITDSDVRKVRDGLEVLNRAFQ